MSKFMSVKVINQIPFIDHIPTNGKSIFMQPYYDEKDNQFKLYLENESKELIFVYAEPYDCFYWSNNIVDKRRI